MVHGSLASRPFIAPQFQAIVQERLRAWCEENGFAETSWQANDAVTRMISLLEGCGHEEASFRELMATFK
ncbi:hypothetical protein FHX08_005616 [Rhizobium sp. BK529]|uniref:hypothetical protein n=1 Tax=Rhizobium sp. BK529 TaxID=2586983 RepID=UPI001607205C|nr:hypothetical protein [Rhizobium sp. BK529]MBB3595206.1 hypothetical protein [Rhizobium sp. BK529]